MRSSASTTVTSRAELAEGDAEFEADIARADDDQLSAAARRATSASVDEITLPPNGRNGNSTGTEPLARMTCSAVMVTSPSLVFDRAGLAVGEFRPALHHAHLRALQQRRDAAVELVDDAFLPGTVSAKFESGRRCRAKCRDSDFRAARVIVSNSPATWIMAFDGMQPRMRQVPPSRSASTSVVSRPKLAGADRGHIAARPAADDEHFGFDRFAIINP